ncbi:protein BCAP [Discoglossus pictus]
MDKDSTFTEEAEAFLPQLLNRRTHRLQELSPPLSRMTLSENLRESLDGSDMCWKKGELSFDGLKILLTKLKEADSVAISIEKHFANFIGLLPNKLSADRLSFLDVMNISKQKDILWKELEMFKDIRKNLEYLLEKHNFRYNRSMDSKHLEVLMQRILEDEFQNERLKEQVAETEAKTKDLLRLVQLEKATAVKSSHLSKSIETTHCRLQNLVQRKETENERMISQIQNLETTVSRRKMDIEDAKHQISILQEKRTFEKEGLKKAIRVQKQKADRFEAAIENTNAQIKEKEIHLSEAISSCNVWKTHHDSAAEEKASLEVHRETLMEQISDHLKDLKKAKDESECSNEELAEKIRVLGEENAHFNEENGKLKTSISALDDEAILVNRNLLELQEKAKEQKTFVEQYDNQVQKLQLESNDLQERFRGLFANKKQIIENQDMENEKTEANDYFLKNESLEVENMRIKKKSEEMRIKLEKVITQNEILEEKMKIQEQTLQQCDMQLMDKSRECCSLLRLLENAVEEGKKQITEEKKKLLSSEIALQRKLHGLENELKRKKAEQKQLASTLKSFEKTHNLRLEELKHSLELTENRNKSIQNYVHFLKTSYAAMFE